MRMAHVLLLDITRAISRKLQEMTMKSKATNQLPGLIFAFIF